MRFYQVNASPAVLCAHPQAAPRVDGANRRGRTLLQPSGAYFCQHHSRCCRSGSAAISSPSQLDLVLDGNCKSNPVAHRIPLAFCAQPRIPRTIIERKSPFY